MIMIQLTGLSGSGKSTISNHVGRMLSELNYPVEILDGDVYRNSLCKDLGFSRADRKENNRRLGILGRVLVKHQIIVIISTINPYEEDRRALSLHASNIYTVWINSTLETLISRDTKGLYRRAMKDRSNPDFLNNLTGVNDIYEPPSDPDLIIHTDQENETESSNRLLAFMLKKIAST